MADPAVLVVDASVLAAVAFGEARADEGADLLRGRAPGILEQLEGARSLDIVLQSPDWATLPRRALDSGLTAYDAAYLSLAEALGAPLATFDRRLEGDRRLEDAAS